MAYTPEQQQIINRIKAIGRRRGAGPKAIKAALETGAVETNFRNPPGGDADSAGWRQERASLYKNPTNLDASIGRFFDEAMALRSRYGRAGELAAAVQRPAAQYRGRYQQHSAEADALLGRGATGGAGGRPSAGGGAQTYTATTHSFDQTGYDKARGLAVLGQRLARHNPNSALLRRGVVGTQAPDPSEFEHTQLETLTGPKLAQGIAARGYSPESASLIQTVTDRINKVSAQKLPYAWGGGHGAKPQTPGDGVAVDCSGFVSSVLGINPRVSGAMGSVGKPGKGRVNIYYNGEHTLMEVNGHFAGTSATNPGGGAGWIPRSAISPEYLKRFQVRHLD
jgi:hypothetical protein